MTTSFLWHPPTLRNTRVRNIRKYCFIVNDKPTITTTNEDPGDGKDTLTLTCNEATAEAVISYVWFVNSTEVNGETNTTFESGNIREESGDYQCSVKTATQTSEKSDIFFLCEYRFVCVCVCVCVGGGQLYCITSLI